MSENAKTVTFVVIGLLAVAVGVYSRPASAELDEQTLVGQVLTQDFDSTDEAKRLRIVRFDEDTATLREFEVAEQDGLWSIPSKSGYPADAAQQMAQAATSLMDRKILAVASSNAGDHEQFGVIDPLSPKLEVGQKGVGTRVTMSDVHNEPLADLIVGKAVKDAEGQRYVREAGRDIVYVIEIDPSKLSTNFEDWIEKDLLKLNSWDLQQVQVKDYSADMHVVLDQGRPALGLTMDPRSEMTLAYNDTDAKWTAEKLRKFDEATKAYTDFTLAEDEELNTETLNALKTALDDLQIVDVVRKPQGLSNDLKAGADFMNNVEALQDLVSKGFIPARSPSGNGAEELISSDGEVIATMKNGTEYVLRFGNLTNVGTDGNQDAAAQSTTAAAGQSADAKDSDGGVHRYLFVMARLNESAVKRPELEELPALPEEAAKSTSDQSGAEKESATSSETESASEKPADETSAASATDSETDTDADAAETSNAEATEQPPADTAADETQADDTDNADEATPAADDEAKPAGEKKDDVKNVIAERSRIEQENQRKLKEYEESLQKGRDNVKELNLRFGDWYFVVADDVFKKIRLTRDNVIKKKEKKEDAATDAKTNGESQPASIPGAIPGLPTIPGTSN